MSGIDKTYLSWEDYLILKDWCEKTELIYDNGVKGSPMDFLCLYDEPYEEVKPVWNTPTSFDRWLYNNCPLEFIQKRLSEQYSDPKNLNYVPKSLERGKHYTQITKPKYNFRYKWSWWIDLVGRIDGEYWFYGWDSHVWYSSSSLMPPETRSSCAHIKNLTKRKLNRLIKKWNLPIDTILRITNRYVGSEYKIIIRK